MANFKHAKIIPNDGAAKEVTFDLVISEQHDGESTVTRHPVERGVPITDNARTHPAKLTLVVFMSAGPTRARGGESLLVQLENIPERTGLLATLGLAAPIPDAAELLVSTDTSDPVQEMHDQLEYLRISAFLCQVETSTKTYTEMLITKVSMPRTEAGGAEFTIEFEEIFTATSLQAAAPKPLVTAGAPPVNKGAQTPTPTPEAKQPPQSVAAAIFS